MRREDNKYRRFYTESDISSNNSIPVSTDLFHLYSDANKAAEELLASCKQFRSLAQHARRFVAARQNGQNPESPSGLKQLLGSIAPVWLTPQQDLPERNLQIVQQQLELFVQSGNLITSNELSAKVTSCVSALDVADESTPGIQVLGIPTCNRNQMLVRCVESYLSNPVNGSGISHLHIVDDSDQTDPDNQNRQAINKLCRRHETNLLWIDRSYRTRFAEQLSKAGDIPEDVTQFALFGDSRIPFTAGASRNTLLLQAAGTKSTQVDDDTINEIRPAPNMQDELALSTEESHKFVFFPGRDAVSEFTKQHKPNGSGTGNNFFSHHNTLLGRHPGVLVHNEDEVDYDRLSQDRLLKKMRKQDAHIAVTFLGALGDSGMNHHWQRLARNEHSFRKLVEDESSYHEAMCTRQLFRFVSHRSIGDTIYCMGMNMGLDTRRLLPPFMPVQRNEDGTFGVLLHRYFPTACKGYLPYAIRHDPPGRDFSVDKEEALRVGPLRTNDILVAVLLALSEQNDNMGNNGAKNLAAVGKHIKNMSGAPEKVFQEEVRDYCADLLTIRMTFVQQLLNERIDAPDYWKRDAEQVVANFKSLRDSADLCVPSDLPGSTGERLALLQDLMKKYGDLLVHWPAMWRAAVALDKVETLSC
ncbi:hypothetical protein NC796_18180 [Aliifodinibius sp. S!AR15-10]|uniref:hypothetical protein n=1 Tax=Aliifodinibius sp. S!AR15-10 TaxID=2950437 RepID=UPI00285449B1|nr:hypothetical protein [Aliifodinibius sp. S!AR15-10]MDR8393090.1 hypothetical protein [Aliifodinibius sp. S!AR15-10]